MDDRFVAAWARLPDFFGQHVLLSLSALLLGLVLSLPLAIIAFRSKLLRWPLVTAAGIIQTIPSIALLALFYPLMLGLAALADTFLGVDFSALGFLPALLALTLYSMLPILRNTIAGLASVDPAVVEAAQGTGMTERQTLFRVELPLAAPIILAGIRTSAVWVIGTATLSTPIGQTSLGNYIFTGLQTENWVFVLFGCVASAVLALAVDLLLGLVESGIARRSRPRIIAGIAALAVGAALAILPTLAREAPRYVIGAKTFTEQFILSRLISDELGRNGLTAVQRDGLGSTVVLRALAENNIDVYVEYSGTIWANAMGHTDNPGRAAVTAGVTKWLADTYGIEVLGGLGFENAYALAMRRARAEELGARTIGDLSATAPRLVIGGDFEFFGRPEWAALRDAYGLVFREQKQYQSTFMYRALLDGDVDVISAFSSDGRIVSNDLAVLEDPREALPPYDALLLLAPARADDAALHNALRPLIGTISADAMRRANDMVDRDEDKATTRQAAQWLYAEIARVRDPSRAQ